MKLSDALLRIDGQHITGFGELDCTPRMPSFTLHDGCGGRFAIEALSVELRRDHGGLAVDVHLTPRYNATTSQPAGAYGAVAVTAARRYPLAILEDPARLRATVRGIIVDVLTHEVDEWLYADGNRVTEPHE